MAYTVFPNEEQIATFKTKLTDEDEDMINGDDLELLQANVRMFLSILILILI